VIGDPVRFPNVYLDLGAIVASDKVGANVIHSGLFASSRS